MFLYNECWFEVISRLGALLQLMTSEMIPKLLRSRLGYRGSVSTLDFLLVAEPPDVSGRLAPGGHTRQGDLVSLLGRLCESSYFGLLRNPCKNEGKISS